ncbi:dicarboxylate/amino acid:cation symporter [Methylophaga sp. OBS1]|uniref:dicarboxylate/amino acid:cation symporter n=1 Tax=Methylophaga sp. OBS1 TaxID=2991933 RepID=UPI0022592D8D|nr:dicarboxylate/amino acid:cation symporter [Methylophaga sp. OBS1]MCX4190982.1 dicarboxylate/amino acid:cation symporter [Methylophaga sp. OBS1]MCX4192072.1 dicarboxylate/amino acid:cation symporter [Methylophaga sp. OBS1]
MSHFHALVLLGFIIAGAVIGVFYGWYAGEAAMAVAWLGSLFLNALKMTIIPLIIASVVSGIGSLGDIRQLGKLGGYTMVYYLSTTALAVFVGLLVVNWIQPGAGIQLTQTAVPEHILSKQDTGISDIFLSLISPNLFAAASQTELLPLIVFAILFAMALTTIGDRSKPVFAVFDGINEAMMKLVIWIMHFAPVGIFALIAARLGSTGGGEQFMAEISAVGMHVVTVLTGLLLHAIILFCILYFVAHRGMDYLLGMARALVTGFGTASSSATLPLTMECARENKVSPKAVKFVLPLGATINMDGTALYEAAAVMFIAQAYGIELTLMQQGLVFITATLAAIGAAGIPEAGLVTMVIVLTAVGLPLEGIALLLAVDWFLDRFRTTVNIWGDSVGAAVIARLT